MGPRLLIIGAGMAGLTAALGAVRGTPGHQGWPADRVRVVEAAGSVGGRLATRRIGAAVLDHGAQFFTVRSPGLRAEVARWEAAGVVAEWCRGFGVADGHPRYRAGGGMRQLAHHLAAEVTGAGIELVTGRRVAAVIPGADRWTVAYAGATAEPDDATAVVLTPPPAVASPLLAAGPVPLSPAHREALAGAVSHRVLALLTLLDGDPDLPSPGALQQPDDATFSFVADNRAKGISDVPAVTFHTAHDLSARLWDRSDAAVVQVLLPAAARLVAPATIVDHRLVRWRHAGPVTASTEPCLVLAVDPGPLVLAGDHFAGAKVEGAFLSGLAAAAAVTLAAG